ncbi:MAG: glycosyltransferase, partial [Planctomycetota bacterium]
MISLACLCPTYGRFRLVENSIACFLAQDYPAEGRRLLVLDDSGIIPPQAGDGWQVVSVGSRFPSLPAKYNELVRLFGDWPDAYVVWEDDDIYLPWHLSSYARAMSGRGWCHPEQVWSTYSGTPKIEGAKGRFHASLAMRQTTMWQVGGWPNTGAADFDQQLLARLGTADSPANPDTVPSYVFRWGSTDHPHGQGYMSGPKDETWYYKYAAAHRLEPCGELTPMFDQDTAATMEAISKLHPGMFPDAPPAARSPQEKSAPPAKERAPAKPQREPGLPRVMIISPMLKMGGAERWVADLASHLDRARLDVIGVGISRDDEDHELSDLVRLFCPLVIGPKPMAEMANRADVILSWGLPRPPGGPALGVYCSHCATERGIKPAAAAVSRGDYCTAVSEAAAFPFPEGTDVTVIHNGSCVDRLNTVLGRRRSRAKWGLAPDEIAIGHVGRFYKDKAPMAVALAAHELGPPFRAVYIGEGPLEGEIAAAPGCPIIIGRPDSIGDAYAALDCFLLASPAEAMSLSIIEAWLTGVPVVATNVGAIPELERRFGQLVRGIGV